MINEDLYKYRKKKYCSISVYQYHWMYVYYWTTCGDYVIIIIIRQAQFTTLPCKLAGDVHFLWELLGFYFVCVPVLLGMWNCHQLKPAATLPQLPCFCSDGQHTHISVHANAHRHTLRHIFLRFIHWLFCAEGNAPVYRSDPAGSASLEYRLKQICVFSLPVPGCSLAAWNNHTEPVRLAITIINMLITGLSVLK